MWLNDRASASMCKTPAPQSNIQRYKQSNNLEDKCIKNVSYLYERKYICLSVIYEKTISSS